MNQSPTPDMNPSEITWEEILEQLNEGKVSNPARETKEIKAEKIDHDYFAPTNMLGNTLEECNCYSCGQY